MTHGLQITVVTAMRNEGPFVVEWIAHHRALGAARFVVVTNDCDDGTDALLDRLAPAGVTHLRQPGGPRLQWEALALAEATEAVRGADWVAVLDCDEFITLAPPLQALPDLVAACPGADAIVLPWRLFGHSGHLRFADAPVTERFTQAIPPDATFPVATRSFKTLVRWRGGPFARLGIHRPKGAGTAAWVDGSGRPLPDAFARNEGRVLLTTPRIETARVQLNHYSLRSAEDFLVKRARGLPNRTAKPIDATYWAERNFNNVEDRSALRHRPAATAEQARLLALPGVAEAQAAAVTAHRAGIETLLATKDGAHLYSRIALLATSVPPPPADAARLLSLVAAARDRS